MWTRILSLATLVVFVSTNNPGCQNTEKCKCFNYINELEWQCSNYTEVVVKYQSKNKHLNIQGGENLRDCQNVTLPPNVNLENSTILSIEFCPNINITRVTDWFKIKHLKKLSFVAAINDDMSMAIKGSDLKPVLDVEFLEINNYVDLTLDQDFLKYTTKLKTLDLSKNHLIDIGYYFTKNSSQFFDSLNLSSNQITSIPANIFQNVSKLRVLELWHNNLTGLTKEAFSGLEHLKILELSYNHIQQITEDAFLMLSNVQNLSLRSNYLGILHKDTFRKNQKLGTLRLERNSHLQLSDYLLSNLQNLEVVNLDSSKIESLPEHLFEGSLKLITITASNNVLEYLPRYIFKDLVNLQVIDLSKNKLTSLPSFSDLKNVNKLALNDNLIKMLDSTTFEGLPSLRNLNLQNNKIAEIHVSAFHDLKNLNNLDLSFNQWTMPLSEVGSTALNDCSEIEVLRLDNNKIDRFPDELFFLVELRLVNISFNLIDSIPAVTFAKVGTVEVSVDASNNKIKYIDFNQAEILAKINIKSNDIYKVDYPTKLFLNNTKIPCNCSNYDLLLYNYGLFPNLKMLLEIDQKSLFCSDLKEKPISLGPGHCAYDLASCPDSCSCNYRPFNKSLNINCSWRNLTMSPQLNISIPNYFHYNQTTIDLSGNVLTSAPDDTSYQNVTVLNLSQNFIKQVSYVPPRIQELYLENNQISHLSQDFIKQLSNVTELKKLTLKDNPWACNCESRHLQAFLKKYYKKIDASEVRCSLDKALLTDRQSLCPQSSLLMVALPVALSILLSLSVVVALFYRFEYEIEVFLFHKKMLWILRFLCRSQEEVQEDWDRDKVYDIFLSYYNGDSKVAKKLCDELESGEPKFKLCIHERDFEPGEMIQDNVVHSINSSKKTILILTNDYLKSDWCNFEFLVAHKKSWDEGVNRLIVIIKDEVLDEKLLSDALKNYLKYNTYLKWEESYFWPKLRYALSKLNKYNKPKNDKKVRQKTKNMMLKIDEKFEIKNNPSPIHTSTPPLILDPMSLKVKILEGEEPLFKVNTQC